MKDDGHRGVDARNMPLPSSPLASPSPMLDVRAPAFARRRALIVLSSVTLGPLAACVATADNSADTSTGPLDPDTIARHGGTGTGTGTGTPTSTTTATAPHPDAGPPHDAGPSPDGGAPPPDAAAPDAVSSGPCSATPAGESAGPVSAFTLNMWRGVDSLSTPLIIARDSAGLFAYDALCTHAQCSLTADIDPATGQVSCPCHQWNFDGNGVCDRSTSSRDRNLRHYAVALSCDKTIVYVNTAVTVDASTRTPIA